MFEGEGTPGLAWTNVLSPHPQQDKDEVVVVKGGYILSRKQRNQIGEELGPSEVQITEDLFIGPTTLAEREGGRLGTSDTILFVIIREIGQEPKSSEARVA